MFSLTTEDDFREPLYIVLTDELRRLAVPAISSQSQSGIMLNGWHSFSWE